MVATARGRHPAWVRVRSGGRVRGRGRARVRVRGRARVRLRVGVGFAVDLAPSHLLEVACRQDLLPSCLVGLGL